MINSKSYGFAPHCNHAILTAQASGFIDTTFSLSTQQLTHGENGMRHLSEEGFHDFFRHHPMAKVLDVCSQNAHQTMDPVKNFYQVPWQTMEWEINSGFLEQVCQHISPVDYVLVICHHGQFSADVGALLEKAGFKHVYNIIGGYQGFGIKQPFKCRHSAIAISFPPNQPFHS